MMEQHVSSLTIGSQVYFDESKYGICCAVSNDGKRMIIYDGKECCYEERTIADCYLVDPDSSSCYVDMMSFHLQKSYNTVNYKPIPLQKHLYSMEMETIFNLDNNNNNNYPLFDASIENSHIETFYTNSDMYNKIMKSDPVIVVDSQANVIDLECHSISILPCKALPLEFYHTFCSISKSIYLTPQAYIFVYSIGSNETTIQLQNPLISSKAGSFFYGSLNHMNCEETEVSSHSLTLSFSPFSPETKIASVFTIAISPLQSILSYFIFIRDKDLSTQWTQTIQQDIALPANLNHLYQQPFISANCSIQLLTISSLIYYYLHSPSRILTSIQCQEGERQMYLPYLRSFDIDVKMMYLEAKYLICEEDIKQPILDDLSLLMNERTEYIELGLQWKEKGGLFIDCSIPEHTSLIPISFQDHIFYVNNMIDYSFFTQLTTCFQCLHKIPSIVITSFNSAIRSCYVPVTSTDILFQMIDYILTYYPDYIPITTFLLLPSSPSQQLSFLSCASFFQPRISNSIQSPLFFHIDRTSHTFNVQDRKDITDTVQQVCYEGQYYICCWNKWEKDNVNFLIRMQLINSLYHTLSLLDHSFIPPLYKVFSGISSNYYMLDYYCFGPIPKDSIQPVEQTPESLSQLLYIFEQLWSLGYVLNVSNCISIQSQPVLFDVSSLIMVVSIDIQEQTEYKESCIAQIKDTLNIVDDIPIGSSMNQLFSSQPIKDAKWNLPPIIQEQTIQPSSHVKEDKWKEYDMMKVPGVIDFPKYRVNSIMNQSNYDDSDSIQGSNCSDRDSFDSILNEPDNHQVIMSNNEEYSDQNSTDYELSDSSVTQNQLNPPSSHNQLNPPSSHNQFNPPSSHNQFNPPSSHNQLNPPSSHNQFNPPSSQNQLNPPVIPPQLSPPFIPPNFNDPSFLMINEVNESTINQDNQPHTSFSPSQPSMTTQPVSPPTNQQDDSDNSCSSSGSYWNTLLVDSNKRFGISSSDEDDDDDDDDDEECFSSYEDENEEYSSSYNEDEKYSTSYIKNEKYSTSHDESEEYSTLYNENEEKENSTVSENQQELLILPNKEGVDTVFKQSQTHQVSKKEQPIVLQPLSENEKEKEEMFGSRIEQEVSQVEDPQIEYSLKGHTRRIPYHGDEDEDIKRSITHAVLDMSLQHIIQLLQKEETGIYGNQIKSNDDRIENEEIPGDPRYQEFFNDIDMGNEK